MAKSLLVVGKDFDLLDSGLTVEDLEKKGVDVFTFDGKDFIVGSILINSEHSFDLNVYLPELQRVFRETSDILLRAGIDPEDLKLIARFV